MLLERVETGLVDSFHDGDDVGFRRARRLEFTRPVDHGGSPVSFFAVSASFFPASAFMRRSSSRMPLTCSGRRTASIMPWPLSSAADRVLDVDLARIVVRGRGRPSPRAPRPPGGGRLSHPAHLLPARPGTVRVAWRAPKGGIAEGNVARRVSGGRGFTGLWPAAWRRAPSAGLISPGYPFAAAQSNRTA